MGMKEEIEALPVSHDSNGWETIDRADVLRIIAKHAAPTGIMIVPGTRIAPAALVDRWLGGDSIAALAADFELSADAVEATIRQWADERTHRFAQNPCERIAAYRWSQLNRKPGIGTLDYIMGDGQEAGHVSDRDHLVAATVIQWLGSPVGQAFVRDLVENFQAAKKEAKS